MGDSCLTMIKVTAVKSFTEPALEQHVILSDSQKGRKEKKERKDNLSLSNVLGKTRVVYTV